MTDRPAGPDDRLDRCLELLAAHQQRLYLFVAALVPSPADAEEVLQETNIVIWKKFEQFDLESPGSDFLSWAYRIASLEVRDHLRRRSRSVPSFSPAVLEQLAVTSQQEQGSLEERREALTTCLEQLPPRDRELLDACYAPGAQVNQIAEQHDRTPTSVYRSLRRIRGWLANCIERKLQPAG